jgi:hypothetical protein
VGSRENGNPKKDLRPPFFGSFFGRAKNEQIYFQDKESNIRLRGAKTGQTTCWLKIYSDTASSAKPNEQI